MRISPHSISFEEIPIEREGTESKKACGIKGINPIYSSSARGGDRGEGDGGKGVDWGKWGRGVLGVMVIGIGSKQA